MSAAAMAAYRDWAAAYDETPNPVLALEARLLKYLLASFTNKTVLDAGCGTGRWMEYLAGLSARIWGADLSENMLARASQKKNVTGHCVCADLRSLPFADNSFDAVICSFVLSYTPDIQPAIRELARVAQQVVVTDLHPEAMRRGWNRACGPSGQIGYYPYSTYELEIAADSAGLRMAARIDAEFGDAEREIFCAAGREAQFEGVSNCPAVLITKWKR